MLVDSCMNHSSYYCTVSLEIPKAGGPVVRWFIIPAKFRSRKVTFTAPQCHFLEPRKSTFSRRKSHFYGRGAAQEFLGNFYGPPVFEFSPYKHLRLYLYGVGPIGPLPRGGGSWPVADRPVAASRTRATLSDLHDKSKVEWACWRVEWAREHALQAGALASLSEMAPLLRRPARRPRYAARRAEVLR